MGWELNFLKTYFLIKFYKKKTRRNIENFYSVVGKQLRMELSDTIDESTRQIRKLEKHIPMRV